MFYVASSRIYYFISMISAGRHLPPSAGPCWAMLGPLSKTLGQDPSFSGDNGKHTLYMSGFLVGRNNLQITGYFLKVNVWKSKKKKKQKQIVSGTGVLSFASLN